MKPEHQKPNTINPLYIGRGAYIVTPVTRPRNKAVRDYLAKQGRKGGLAGLGIPKKVSLESQRGKIVLREVRAGRLENARQYLEALPAHSAGCPATRRQTCSCVIGRARRAYAEARAS